MPLADLLTFNATHQRLRVDAEHSCQSERDAVHQLKLFGFLVDQVRDGQYSLDQWADASQRREFGEYIDQPFVS